MRDRRRGWVALCVLLLVQANAGAQTRAADPKTVQDPADIPPPYEAQLLRLAELMGTLAYLRDLCGLKDGEACGRGCPG